MSDPDRTIPPLVQVLQTVRACPSEWSAWDADGNWYYLRYRFGRGTVQVCTGGPAPGAHHDDYVEALFHSRTIAEFHHGEPMQGEITLEEFTALWREAPVLDDPPDHLRNKKEGQRAWNERFGLPEPEPVDRLEESGEEAQVRSQLDPKDAHAMAVVAVFVVAVITALVAIIAFTVH